MKKRAANAAASIRAKLLNVSRTAKQEFQFVLDRWAAERFLYRLGRSPLRESFVLKGATLFLIWRGALPRRTRDIGLLAQPSQLTAKKHRRPVYLQQPVAKGLHYIFNGAGATEGALARIRGGGCGGNCRSSLCNSNACS